MAVPKPAGGIRPIAIGETLRRLVGKCLMSTVRDDARNHFWPEQAGVAVPAGADGHARVVHVMRCNPPSAQHAALVAFDTRTRHCFAALTGLHLNRVQWHQAVRGFAQAGLGLRLAAADAPAAYLASCGGAARACGQLDAGGFDMAALTETPKVRVLLNSQLDQPLTAQVAFTKRQGDICDLLDAANWRRQLSSATPVAKAMLLPEAQPGAVPRGRCRGPSGIHY